MLPQWCAEPPITQFCNMTSIYIIISLITLCIYCTCADAKPFRVSNTFHSSFSSSSTTPPMGITIGNNYINATFDTTTNTLIQIQDITGTTFLLDELSVVDSPWWSMVLLLPDPVTINSLSDVQSGSAQYSQLSATMEYNFNVYNTYQFTIQITVFTTSETDTSLQVQAAIIPLTPNIGVYSFRVIIPCIVSDNKHRMYWPAGFGMTAIDPIHTIPQMSAIYPSSNAAFQLVMHVADESPYSGISLSTYDSNGASKLFDYSSHIEEGCLDFSVEIYPSNNTAAYEVSTSPVPFYTYPIVIQVFQGDWYDGSDAYTRWALEYAPWTKAGLLRERTDIPSWALWQNVWVNSGWQRVDIFNSTEGDPSTVATRVANIVELFNLSTQLGLHWYEWNEWKFDTHYPDYFPVKDGFVQVTKQLQTQYNVTVAPYINGRIFDIGIEKWKDDNAILYACKNVTATLNSNNYSIYGETYGSGASFAVMCPYTNYWQTTLIDVVEQLVTDGVDAVYIDQIGAAEPRRCYDPTHGHELGSGEFWLQGYTAFLENLRSIVTTPLLLLTESNTEVYMAHINTYLTLVAFSQNQAGNVFTTPIFPRIYGGLYLGMGSMFYVSDLTPNPDVFTVKLAWQMLTGVQMGWLSLGGTSTTPPMGLYDYLITGQYTNEIAYLQLLDLYKTQAREFVQFGRRTRDVVTQITEYNNSSGEVISKYIHPKHAPTYTAKRSDDNNDEKQRGDNKFSNWSDMNHNVNDFVYSQLISSTWLFELGCTSTNAGLGILFASPTSNYHASITFNIDLNNYGLHNTHGVNWNLLNVDQHGNEGLLGVYDGSSIQYQGEIGSRQVIFLKIIKHVAHDQVQLS